MPSSTGSAISQSLYAAERFLISAQDSDGFWRDYVLPPGMSTAWTTACVGWSLAFGQLGGGVSIALESARKALHSERRSAGWGYNSSVSIDADTTSWVFRLMATAHDPLIRDATTYLRPFITDSGGARTFQNPDRLGSWAQEHADVTPIAGLALLECGGDQELISRIRSWCLVNQREDGAWNSFWWSTDAYSTARNLEFLLASGGIPETTLDLSRQWLLSHAKGRSPFEATHLLIAFVACGMARVAEAERLVGFLQELPIPDGSWPASKVLRLPDQQRDNPEAPVFEDCRRLMSTAVTVQALKLWLQAQF